MQRVLVLDKNKQPLMPCHPARARQLLREGKATVFRRYPFTIILKDREGGDTQPVAFKVDPGSRITGIALVAVFQHGKRCIWAADLQHRGQLVRDNLLKRSQIRRSRRHRKNRYRPARFDNRKRPAGWLPPSLMSRLNNIATWLKRLNRFAPITSLSQELVRFDTQSMQNPEISGVEYQQGELAGYEVREYLLEKWGRKCAYCGAKDTPLEVEHIVPKSRGGSNRVSNLTIACNPCNVKKGNQTAAEFGYPEIQSKAKLPLKDAAMVNASRWVLYGWFKSTGLPVEVGSGGRTKYNRIRQDYPKAHWLDAVCVGESGERVFVHSHHHHLIIKAKGRQSRRMCQMSKYGFPKTKPRQGRAAFGFQTGDIVKVDAPKGRYIGRVTIRASGSFMLAGQTNGINWKYCKMLHRNDGYEYSAGQTS